MKKTIIITLLTFLLFSCSQEKMKEETIQKQNNEIEIQESNMQEIKENKDREQKITQKDYEGNKLFIVNEKDEEYSINPINFQGIKKYGVISTIHFGHQMSSGMISNILLSKLDFTQNSTIVLSNKNLTDNVFKNISNYNFQNLEIIIHMYQCDSAFQMTDTVLESLENSDIKNIQIYTICRKNIMESVECILPGESQKIFCGRI